MAIATVEERVRKCVALVTDPARPTLITLDSKFMDDLGMDSLDTVECVMDLEAEFDIDIPDTEAAEWRTVGDAVRWLTEHAK